MTRKIVSMFLTVSFLLACTPLPEPPEDAGSSSTTFMVTGDLTLLTSGMTDEPTGDSEPFCGDGMANPDNPKHAEQCDGEDLGSYEGQSILTCADLPQGGQVGALTCREDCKWDTSRCTPNPLNCNNGLFDQGEECDATVMPPG